MAMEMWETLKESITAYTGLSPATFFTVVALALVTLHVFSGLFGTSSSSSHYQKSMEDIGDDGAAAQPLPPPVQVGEITVEELKQYDGSDPNKPLLMAIKGQIYDVSLSRGFYGPGGPYALFAGRDASRALAKMSFNDKDLTGDVSGLDIFEQDALRDWEHTFMSKYVKVGTVKIPDPASEATANGERPQAAAVNGEASKPAEGSDDHAPKPVEVNECDAAKPDEITNHDSATKPSEGSPSETADGGVSVADDDKKE